MVVVMKNGAKETDIKKVCTEIENKGLEAHITKGMECAIIGIVGDTTKIDEGILELFDGVDKIIHIQEPYKKANRKFHPENSVINVNGVEIGGNKTVIIAGPCSVESEEQIISIAKSVKASGASFLRGGAFKPRTSPYSFQGMGEDGLELLKLAKKEVGIPLVSELTSLKYLDKFIDDIDIIQIGARNMQNYDLLKELGQINKPILLKRGLSATIEELILSAEYIMSSGNERVILCERGIRTFETYTRNTLDISAIPAIKKLTHLPIIIDPSHAAGIWWMVDPLAKASIACGADGLIIEVHNDPLNAKCDGQQSINPERFDNLIKKLSLIAEVDGRVI